MFETLQIVHSYWAYLTLLLIVLATLNAFKGMFSNSTFKAKDFKISLFALIVTHIQILIGLFLYIYSPNAMGAIKTGGMGSVMKDSLLRFSSVEHPLMMLIAVILITIGYSKHKKKDTDKAKFKTISIFYGIALLLVLSRIPWGTWFN
jgi:heme A synthase